MRTVTILLGFLFISSLAFAESLPLTAERPDIKVGERWSYRTIDMFSDQEKGKYEYVVTGGDSNNIEFERKTMSSLTEAKVGKTTKRRADRSTLTYENASLVEGKYVAFNFPLSVGAKWEYAYSTRSSSGNVTDNSRSVVVENWEDVEVPAGRFRALKVVHSGNLTATSGTGGARTSSVSETFWYVPEVKRYVKYEYIRQAPSGYISGAERIRDELVEFEVK